jgi:putative NADPH-quinone reductase
VWTRGWIYFQPQLFKERKLNSMSTTETMKDEFTKQKKDKPQQKNPNYTVFDYELIQASKSKTVCEFDLGSQRIRGYPVSVDVYMVKVNVGDVDSPVFKWIGKHHIVVCTAGSNSAVSLPTEADTALVVEGK